MTDLEMTKLCAEAMGIKTFSGDDRGPYILGGRTQYHEDGLEHEVYNPLHDDAQAMALLKRFQLRITQGGGQRFGPSKYVHVQDTYHLGSDEMPYYSDNMDADLNRAIVECVAKMQKASTLPAQLSTENTDSF